ncbi:GPI anchored hypothetical protein [Penicillium waksmanii]|uniref:GPI anchored hypothetical protein n=1 Tax=Penicillium waksmanii TaxID=69791 RepID=UPI002548F72F|nr:GPI anchored hypothetical protein [Penicillium waksmanii]KAJ5966292.1 GPI anchored hypothetical protein [Penicillium waksmanii]
MQFKTLAALLFASAALAAPAPDSTATAESSSYDDSDDYDSALESINIPSSVIEILATATAEIAWANSMYTNSDYAQAEVTRVADGKFPSWVTELPESAQTYVENELKAEASAYLASESLTSAATDDTSATETGSSASASSAAVTKTSSETSTETNTGSSSGTATPSGTASGSSKSGSSTSTSTAGAPAATGGIAMSLAGAAGVLGLALAL